MHAALVHLIGRNYAWHALLMNDISNQIYLIHFIFIIHVVGKLCFRVYTFLLLNTCFITLYVFTVFWYMCFCVSPMLNFVFLYICFKIMITTYINL